jgi:hypothetical protein
MEVGAACLPRRRLASHGASTAKNWAHGRQLGVLSEQS